MVIVNCFNSNFTVITAVIIVAIITIIMAKFDWQNFIIKY